MAADDEPSGLGLIPVPDGDALTVLPDEPSTRHPLAVAAAFATGVEDPVHYRAGLLALTTPESHAAWGDFARVADLLVNHGLATGVIQALDEIGERTPDVVYVRFVDMAGMGDFSYVADGEVLLDAQVLSMVWRPEFDSWLIHSIGDYLRPEELPRSSPGTGPIL